MVGGLGASAAVKNPERRRAWGSAGAAARTREEAQCNTTSQHCDEELVKISHRAYERGLVAGISGNNSVRVPGHDAALIKVTGVCQGDMDRGDTVLVGLDGSVLEEGRAVQGGALAPGDLPHQPGVNGIVHVHPPYATAWAVAGRVPPLIHTAARGILSGSPWSTSRRRVRAAGRAGRRGVRGPGAERRADARARHLSVGPDLRTAYYHADYLEDTARVALLAAQVRRSAREASGSLASAFRGGGD